MAKIKNDSTFMDGTVIRDLIDSKSTFSGSYNDLTDTPVGLATETYVDNAVGVDEDTLNSSLTDLFGFVTTN